MLRLVDETQSSTKSPSLTGLHEPFYGYKDVVIVYLIYHVKGTTSELSYLKTGMEFIRRTKTGFYVPHTTDRTGNLFKSSAIRTAKEAHGDFGLIPTLGLI